MTMMASIVLMGLSLLIGYQPAAFAQTQTGASPSASLSAPVSPAGGARGTAVDMDKPIGVAAAVSGHVEAQNPAQGSRVLQSGMPIFLGDKISTDGFGRVQILLRDETIFTVGQDSEIVMDEFIYDPATEAGKVGAEMVKGTFRFISGKVARKDPKDMQVKLPVGNIGIRGTIVGTRITGERSMVVLLGPGDKKNTQDRKGSITVSNEVKDKVESTEVNRAGFGTNIEGPDQAPSRPYLVPIEQIAELSKALEPMRDASQADTGAGDGASATQQAGQDTFGAFDDVADNDETSDVSEDADSAVAEAAQNATQIGSVADGIATLENLRQIEAGQFKFESTSSISLAPSGSFSFYFDIDFGARTVGGGNSRVGGSSAAIDGGDDFQFNIPVRSFAGSSGNASFSYNDIPDTDGAVKTALLDATFNIKNSGGIVATDLDASVDINSGTATGSGTASRTQGLTAPE